MVNSNIFSLLGISNAAEKIGFQTMCVKISYYQLAALVLSYSITH
ncbi:MAG: hypothetical protein PF694_15410 [Bacteroidetes bacterium]|jgi:hypothetical protein|nr:hypothetical protein [Bacteroidota bacterium]